MVDYINTRRAHHILTIEDPIEFIHPVKRGTVNQREIGRDTLSYAMPSRGPCGKTRTLSSSENSVIWRP